MQNSGPEPCPFRARSYPLIDCWTRRRVRLFAQRGRQNCHPAARNRFPASVDVLDHAAVDLGSGHNAFRASRFTKDGHVVWIVSKLIESGNEALGTPEKVNKDPAIEQLQKLQDNDKFGASRLEQELGRLARTSC